MTFGYNSPPRMWLSTIIRSQSVPRCHTYSSRRPACQRGIEKLKVVAFIWLSSHCYYPHLCRRPEDLCWEHSWITEIVCLLCVFQNPPSTCLHWNSTLLCWPQKPYLTSYPRVKTYWTKTEKMQWAPENIKAWTSAWFTRKGGAARIITEFWVSPLKWNIPDHVKPNEWRESKETHPGIPWWPSG